MTADELVPRQQAILELRISDATYRRWVRAGWLHVVKRGRRSFVTRAELELRKAYGRTGTHPPADELQNFLVQHERERWARVLALGEGLLDDWLPLGAFSHMTNVEVRIACIREADRRLQLQETRDALAR
jgi:hypothetical protein